MRADQLDENLHKWFKEKWVRFGPDGKIKGDCARGSDSEGKPKCLPQAKAHSLGKKGRASAAARKRREDPNPERSGKAINVATKKKTSEGVAENSYRYASDLAYDRAAKQRAQNFNWKSVISSQDASSFNEWFFSQRDLPADQRDPAFDEINTIRDQVSKTYRNDYWHYIWPALEQWYNNKSQSQGVAEGSLNEGQYEMMLGNGQVRKFVAKDDADAKRIAAGHGAKSLIRLKGGVPAGKVSEQGVAEDQLDELKCWPGYHRVKGTKAGFPGSCAKNTNEADVEENISRRGILKGIGAAVAGGALGAAAKPASARVTIGPDGQVQGGFVPSPVDPNKPQRQQPPEEPKKMVGADLPQADKADRTAGTVSIDGKEYKMVLLGKDDPRPRAMPNVAIPIGLLGFRGLGNFLGVMFGNTVYVLPHGEYEESLHEEQDLEGATAKNSLHTIMRVASHLDKQMKNGENLPEWVSEKIGSIKDQMVNVMDYEISNKELEKSIEEKCPNCGGPMFEEAMMNEKKDACYYKVKSRYKVWPSAYASGALVKCRKKGAKNWGNKSESIAEALNELKQQTLASYKEKAGAHASELDKEAFGGAPDAKEKLAKAHKRFKGINKATMKQFNQPKKQVDEFVQGYNMNQAGVRKIKPAHIPNQDEIQRMSSISEGINQLEEKWSEKYKRSIDCSHPKGFSQKAHCQGRKKK